MREFGRVMTGPGYARALVRRAETAGVDIRVKTSVVKIGGDAKLRVSSPDGISNIIADRIIIATGVRETPRSARFVSGARPLAVTTVGAMQSMIYLNHRIPFKRPLVVGSELVSFSALWTCFGAGIKPVAMLEKSDCILARWPAQWLPRLLRIPLLRQSRVVRILGRDRVTGVTISDRTGQHRDIACDGIVFSGQFTPESSLARAAALDIDVATKGPVIDQFGRCSNPRIFATGNLLRPLETAGWCWREGKNVGNCVADDLQGVLPSVRNCVAITLASPLIKLAVPQRIQIPYGGDGMRHIQIRFTQACNGRLILRSGNTPVWQKSLNAKPERRVLIPLSKLELLSDENSLQLDFQRADSSIAAH
jgi:pyruvate/2-oxoglutarate dehydrogenase complex dihydrolipoamide dehydrogenase (E3) component